MLLDRVRRREGYIAVISAIITTAIVIVIALVFSSSNFLGRFDTQGLELKDLSKGIALGCLEYAKLQLRLGNYSGNETVNIGEFSCKILPIEESEGKKIIKSTANVNNRITNLKLTADGSSLETISLEEISSF